jgi:hypothetical protein
MKPSVVLAALAALGVAGCNTPAPQAAAPPAPGSVAVTPQGFQLPDAGDCKASIARYRAVQDNDLSMGHVAKSVYTQIQHEIAAAETACAAGHDAQAKAMITASEQRHGYPTGI